MKFHFTGNFSPGASSMGNGHVTDVTVSVRGELVVGMEGEVGRTASAVLSMHVASSAFCV